MNADRRKRLATALQDISNARAAIETLAEEERDAFDNMPEGIQQGENGQRMEANCDSLDELVSNLEDCETWTEAT